jgi:hypothetical protein
MSIWPEVKKTINSNLSVPLNTFLDGKITDNAYILTPKFLSGTMSTTGAQAVVSIAGRGLVNWLRFKPGVAQNVIWSTANMTIDGVQFAITVPASFATSTTYVIGDFPSVTNNTEKFTIQSFADSASLPLLTPIPFKTSFVFNCNPTEITASMYWGISYSLKA